MKAPKYIVRTTQQAIDLHLNAFALQLIAESFGDDPDKFGDENVVFILEDHRHREVYFILTKTAPTEWDFDPPDVPDEGTPA